MLEQVTLKANQAKAGLQAGQNREGVKAGLPQLRKQQSVPSGTGRQGAGKGQQSTGLRYTIVC